MTRRAQIRCLFVAMTSFTYLPAAAQSLGDMEHHTILVTIGSALRGMEIRHMRLGECPDPGTEANARRFRMSPEAFGTLLLEMQGADSVDVGDFLVIRTPWKTMIVHCSGSLVFLSGSQAHWYPTEQSGGGDVPMLEPVASPMRMTVLDHSATAPHVWGVVSRFKFTHDYAWLPFGVLVLTVPKETENRSAAPFDWLILLYRPTVEGRSQSNLCRTACDRRERYVRNEGTAQRSVVDRPPLWLY
jgi:hypothetical protein